MFSTDVPQGCIYADIITLSKSTCLECPFSDCLRPECNKYLRIPEFISLAVKVFSHTSPLVFCSLFGVSLKTYNRYKRG